MRRQTASDRLIGGLAHALSTAMGPPPLPAEPYPGEDDPEAPMDEAARRHAAGLMRVNHAGEVCAQALYLGQAAVSRDPELRRHLIAAAGEEADHLAWCARRLGELGDRASLLNPLWYAGSFAIGAAAGIVGDRVSLGFIVETERQVESHLGDHLERLPPGDERSRSVVRQMQSDEARHGAEAKSAGAVELPPPVPTLMAAAAAVMKALAYRI